MIPGLSQQGEGLAVRDEETGEDVPVPAAGVLAAFERYAKPLAAAPPPADRALRALELALPGGGRGRLRAFHFRGWGDVLPSDYLLLERDGLEPIAGPAPLILAALRHLASAARRPSRS